MKEFDITEFICEKLVGISNIRSAHYISIFFGDYKRCLARAKYGNDRGNIIVGSPNFKKEDVTCFSSFDDYRRMIEKYPQFGISSYKNVFLVK